MVMNAPVRALAYLGIEVTDVEAWRTLWREVIGAEDRQDGGDGAIRLRLDDRHHRIALRPGAADRLQYVGWEVATEADLDALTARIEAAGIEVSAGTAAERADRRVGGLARFVDPLGVPCELAWGCAVDDVPFRPSRPMSGFVTGEQGLGHVVFMAADADGVLAFYRDVLGFRVSDVVTISDLRGTFLHCNPRHHSLAIVDAPSPDLDGRLLHFMLEVQSLDDVGRAYDRCPELDVPIAMSLGRHVNDLMTSFYLRTPSGFEIEYGFGGQLLRDRDPIVVSYDAPSFWGHRGLLDERATP